MIKKLFICIGVLLLTSGCADSQPTAAASETQSQNIRLISVADAATMIQQNDNAVVLDVRTPEEFSRGRIEGALNIDFKADDFENKIAALDKTKPYILHCQGGGRSARAEEILVRLGFTDVSHLKEGFAGWSAAGLAQIAQ